MSKYVLKYEEKIEDFKFDKIIFPYFPSRADIIKPIGDISLSKFIQAHKEPKESMIKVFEAIEDAAIKGDKKLKDNLKQTKLFYFTPSVVLKERNYSSIESFTGLLVAEYDGLSSSYAEKLKRQIFEKFKSCILAYTSPSKSGCKFIFKIPIVTSVEEYKEYYFGLSFYLSQIKGFDTSNQNPTLPLFLSYDKDMLVRCEDEIETWILKGINLDSVYNKKNTSEIDKVDNPTDSDRKRIFRIVDSVFEKIEEEQKGHEYVRNVAYTLGGYVGCGYLTEDEAIDYMNFKITGSSYCNSRQDYYKTSVTSIRKGQSLPLLLETYKN